LDLNIIKEKNMIFLKKNELAKITAITIPDKNGNVVRISIPTVK